MLIEIYNSRVVRIFFGTGAYIQQTTQKHCCCLYQPFRKFHVETCNHWVQFQFLHFVCAYSHTSTRNTNMKATNARLACFRVELSCGTKLEFHRYSAAPFLILRRHTAVSVPVDMSTPYFVRL